MVRSAEYGAQRLDKISPGYAEAMRRALPETESTRILSNYYRHRFCRFPKPSEVFVGLDGILDSRLLREKRAMDASLCGALAVLPRTDQREFLDLYLVDPVDAQRWAMLSKWKRPIRKGDKDDRQVWKFFTMQRLNMEQAAREAPPWSMQSQGAQLPQMFGVLSYLSMDGFKKLIAVMSAYGAMLAERQDVGDVVREPWA